MTGTERLASVPLRELWPHEAADFTPWLAENIDLLGEALDMTFDSAETEAPVGGFSADVVAVNDQGETVLVENFLNPSDHCHLGQLVTYAAGLGAHYAVLVAESLRDEHRSALGWLNRHHPRRRGRVLRRGGRRVAHRGVAPGAAASGRGRARQLAPQRARHLR